MWAHTEVVDPVALGAKIIEPADNSCHCCCCDADVNSVPECICSVFEENLVAGDDTRKVVVTLGLFTIVRLEREVQLVIPVIDFCIPQDECRVTSSESNPCEIFENLCFPIDEFFPPEKGCLGDNGNGRCL